MSGTFLPLLARDLRLLMFGGRRGGAMLPVLFFLAVAMLYPFAVGPDAPLLARTGGGVIWVAALLAAILPLDRLIEPDLELGFFDQWALRGISEEALVAIRVLAHWLSFGPPLMLAALPASVLVGIDGDKLAIVELGLLPAKLHDQKTFGRHHQELAERACRGGNAHGPGPLLSAHIAPDHAVDHGIGGTCLRHANEHAAGQGE